MNVRIATAVIGAALTLTGCAGTVPAHAPRTSTPAVSARPVTAQPAWPIIEDPTDQAKLGPLFRGNYGERLIHVVVTNRSAVRSNFSVIIAIETADHTQQLTTTIADVQGLEPGQFVKTDALLGTDPLPADAVGKVLTVIRTASN